MLPISRDGILHPYDTMCPLHGNRIINQFSGGVWDRYSYSCGCHVTEIRRSKGPELLTEAYFNGTQESFADKLAIFADIWRGTPWDNFPGNDRSFLYFLRKYPFTLGSDDGSGPISINITDKLREPNLHQVCCPEHGEPRMPLPPAEIGYGIYAYWCGCYVTEALDPDDSTVVLSVFFHGGSYRSARAKRAFLNLGETAPIKTGDVHE